MAHTTTQPLTSANLKSLLDTSSPLRNNHFCPSTSSSSCANDDDDALSLFSHGSPPSTVSSAPDDEPAPYTIEDVGRGETITVYSSLDQAVRYSLLRVEEDRRREEWARSGMMVDGLLPAPPVGNYEGYVEAGWTGEHGGEVDEDAYFSMG